MTDIYGCDTFITLERIDDNKKHTLDNVKLACSACNSSHINTPLNLMTTEQIYEVEVEELEINHEEINALYTKLKVYSP